MVIGVLQMELRIPEAHSLKEKRWRIKSLVSRLRERFNISVSEVDFQEAWQRATLAVAHVGNGRPYTNQLLDQVLNFVEGDNEIEVVDSKLEFL